MSNCKNDNLIWLDLEMSGLDIKKNVILEIATVITNNNLDIIAQGPVFAIRHSKKLLDNMDNWNKKHHSQSGLIARVLSSKINAAKAEEETLKFLKKYVPKNKSPLCGNSIWQDRKFLQKFMPQLEEYFHYRHIDVSTLKELALRWGKNKIIPYKKNNLHEALADIYESINELKYYRENMLK